MNPHKPVYRIGSGAGFAGDRVDPAVALAASGKVDAVALECLAERTLVPAIKARADNSEAGADPRLARSEELLRVTADESEALTAARQLSRAGRPEEALARYQAARS